MTSHHRQRLLGLFAILVIGVLVAVLQSGSAPTDDAATTKHGVAFLECDSADIGGIRLAGATLWGEDDPRHWPSVQALAVSRCDVAITHFEPTPKALSLVGARLWIHGHHNGHGVLDFGRTKVIRNAGWPDEMLQDASPPAVPGFVVEV